MKKFRFLLIALTMMSATLAQEAGAQQKAVKVQGHPHELLTKKAAASKQKPQSQAARQDATSIDPDEILCWIDEPNVTVTDTAYLVVKFTDGKRTEEGDSLLVWGYRYAAVQYGDSIPHHTIDMLRTVANNDTRLTVLLQYAGVSGYAVGGIGFNYDGGCSRVPLEFDYSGAAADSRISFHYTGSPNCSVGQVAVPSTNPDTMAENAIKEGRVRGVIEDPFNAFYGYPAYDYDYWKLDPPGNVNVNYEWQAGWYNGYWGFYMAPNRRIPGLSDYTSFGITYEELHNQDVHGFVFETGAAYPPAHDFSGDPTYVNCSECRACQTSKSVQK